MQDLTAQVAARDAQLTTEREAHRQELAAINERLTTVTAEAAATLAGATAREENLRQQLTAEQAERQTERREHQRALDELRGQLQEQQTGRPTAP